MILIATSKPSSNKTQPCEQSPLPRSVALLRQRTNTPCALPSRSEHHSLRTTCLPGCAASGSATLTDTPANSTVSHRSTRARTVRRSTSSRCPASEATHSAPGNPQTATTSGYATSYPKTCPTSECCSTATILCCRAACQSSPLRT
ncbi:hypothetical protein FOCG_17879 [Fusarium oxysporum f. sp. radicis-lycopersici 26381]|nr:hypothetical protein FOCG_17879 [Fusarium oxysporum f. sp. radicis-lycopersici 26381]